MASRLVVPLAVLALTAAACSGGDESADTTSPTSAPTTPSTTAAPPTTPAPTTTTTAPPTTAPPTTAPPTTAPPTTPPPTATGPTESTLALWVPDGFTLEEVQAINRDYREGLRLLYAALEDVSDETAVQAALAYTTGEETAFATELIDEFRANSRRLIRLPEPPESFERLQGPTRLANGDVGLSICHVAPYRTVEADPDSETGEVVLNPDVVTQRTAVDLRLVDNVWKRSATYFQGQWEGVVRCQDVS